MVEGTVVIVKAIGSEEEDDDSAELALMSNPDFICAMNLILQGFEESNIDWDKVKKVSLEELKAKYSSKKT